MISLLLGSFLSTAQAVPMQLSQQGRLVDSSGVAAAGNHNLTFRLYNASTGGTLLWNETVSTNFTNGYYSVVLGSDTINNPLQDSVLESGDLFIEIEIDSDGPLTPRSAVTSTPFARVAGKAQSADWGGLTSVPAGLSDGDDDTVGSLNCADGEQPVYSSNSGSWTCGNPVVDVDADNRLAALEALVASLQTDLSTANSTIATLQSSVGTNTTDIASNASDITGLDTDLTAAEGNITSLQASVTTNTTDIASLQSDVTTLQGSVLDLIDTDTTWNIGSNGDYTNLADAMAAARSVRIHPDATLTLQIANDIYTVSDTINLNHPDGANIVIQGNSADSALVQLEFTGTDGFYLSDGHSFGGLNDLTLRGDLTSNEYGIFIREGASILISNIVSEDFHNGLRVRTGSIARLSEDCTFQDNLHSGIVVEYDSTIIYDTGTGTLTTSSNSSDGVHVTYNSTAAINDIVAENNGRHGIQSVWNSHVLAMNGTFNSNGSYGVYGTWNSALHLQGGVFNENGANGVGSLHRSIIYANNAEASNNASSGFVTSYMSSMYASNATANDNVASYGYFAGRGSWQQVHNSLAAGNGAYAMYKGVKTYTYDYANGFSGSTYTHSSSYTE